MSPAGQPPILPSNLSPLGALPARFRRERVLLVGCGDVGLRVAVALGGGGAGRPRLLALTSSPERLPQLRSYANVNWVSASTDHVYFAWADEALRSDLRTGELMRRTRWASKWRGCCWRRARAR